MNYKTLQSKIMKLKGNYFCELDRLKVNGRYVQKNRVHIFKESKPFEIAKIYEDNEGDWVAYEDLPAELISLIRKYSFTKISNRGVDNLTDHDVSVLYFN